MRNKDELEGKGKQVKGTVKEKLGKFAQDRNLQESGARDRTEGKVQEDFGKGRRKIGEALQELGDEIAS